jgi:hypothetical protein
MGAFEEYRRGFNDAIEGLEDLDADGLAVMGLMRLPKDTDGIPIRVGDIMEWEADGETFCVLGVGSNILFYTEDGKNARWTVASSKRRHKVTVKGLLAEFSQKMNENMGMYTSEAIDADEWRSLDERTIEEYAAKLQLMEVE